MNCRNNQKKWKGESKEHYTTTICSLPTSTFLLDCLGTTLSQSGSSFLLSMSCYGIIILPIPVIYLPVATIVLLCMVILLFGLMTVSCFSKIGKEQ